MRLQKLIIASTFVLAGQGAMAQVGNIYLEDSSIQVVQQGQKRNLAWCGGFNSPGFSTPDLNHDGLNDLVVYEWKERTVRTFLNKGTNTSAYYIYAPKYAKAFPPIYDYIYMPDYNRDGIPDLVQRGSRADLPAQGFGIFKGYYNSDNELNFTFYKDLRYDSPDFGNVNAYSQGSDIPAVVDADGDGDIDFFGFDVNGGIISFYKNCQVEKGYPKDSIIVCNPTNCWGYVFQGFDRVYTLGLVPTPNGGTCSTKGNFGCRVINGQNVWKETRHQGNCMLMLDYDGDGDIDLLDGNISFPDLQFLKNGRAQFGGKDSIISQDTVWAVNGKQVKLPNWPSSFYVDADGDGKKDILVTPHDLSAAENYKCIQLFKNTGTATVPAFSYQNDTFLIERTIDMGTASYPVLYDYNRDGRLDLFVGSEGLYQAGGTYRSRINYYQNSVSGSITSLVWQTNDFMNIFAENFSGAAPAFGDIDGDGLDDMVIGHTDGTLSFYKNLASSNAVQPQWSLTQLMLTNSTGDTIDVGYNAVPYIYDIDLDGKKDLLIGNQSGRIVYYKSSGTGSAPTLTFVTNTLGNFKADTANVFTGYSSIWIGKMDVTNQDYLISGNDLGKLVRYTGFQGGNVSTPYQLLTDNYSGIDIGARSTITAGDIDKDGKMEFVIGNTEGGLFLYKQGPVVSVGGPSIADNQCQIYPNPAKGSATLTWEPGFSLAGNPVDVVLYNALGQLCRQQSTSGSARALNIDLRGLVPGIYSCRVSASGKTAVLKLIVTE
jgi:hypothetical protein